MRKLFIEVEYDLTYYGGDYTQTGDTVLVPLDLCNTLGTEKAFEKFTGYEQQHIVSIREDELYDEEGEVVDDATEEEETAAATVELEIKLFGNDYIKLTINGNAGNLESNLKDKGNKAVKAAVDGLESLILAHAIKGVDVTASEYVEGIQTALEAIGNNLGAGLRLPSKV